MGYFDDMPLTPPKRGAGGTAGAPPPGGYLADLPMKPPKGGYLADLPMKPAAAPSFSALAPKAGVDITGLASDARPVLADLDSALAGRGIRGIITSGFQKRAQESEHSHGRAVDFVLPGHDMAAIAADLQRDGFHAQFERKGQVNANGSVATGDHIHLSLRPRSAGGVPGAGLLLPRPAPAAAELNPLKPPLPAFRPSRDSTPATPSRPAPRQGSGPAAVADLMGSLLRGEHLQPGAKPAAPRTSTAPQPGAPSAPGPPSHNLLSWFGALSNSYAAYMNQLGREGKRIPSITQDPAGHFRALPSALRQAFVAGVQHFGPEAVTPTHFREMFNLERGKAPRAAYNAAAVADYVSSILTDPSNLVGSELLGPVLGKGWTAAGKLAGKAKAPVSRAVDVALSKTAIPTGRAIGTGLAVAEHALQKVPGAGPTIVGGVKSGVQTVSRMAEKTPPFARTLTGWMRAALLSRPSSVFTNAVVNPIQQVGDELARHGIPLAKAAANVPAVARDLATYHKAGQASADVAELLHHAPGLLDAPVALGGQASTWNPFLKAMGASDNLAKATLFRTLREAGVDAATAAQRVRTAMFDYGGLNKTLRAADKNGLFLFGSFLMSSTKSFASQILTRPDLVNRYQRLQQQLFDEFPGSREDFQQLPERNRTPFTYPIGGGRFVDLQRFHSWAVQLGTLQDILAHGLPAAGLPGLEGVVGHSIAGPLVGAVTTEKRSTTPAEGLGVPAGWPDLFQRLLPILRDAAKVNAARKGVPLSDRKDDEAQSLLQALGQAALGASIVRAEPKMERLQRQAPALDLRARAGNRVVSDVEHAVRDQGRPNPYVARFNIDELQREFGDAQRDLNKQIVNPLNSKNGVITPEGRKRIEVSYLKVRAISRRLDELTRARKTAPGARR